MPMLCVKLATKGFKSCLLCSQENAILRHASWWCGCCIGSTDEGAGDGAEADGGEEQRSPGEEGAD